MSTDLAQLVARTECLLLDFDGSVCSVFTGVPAPVVAQNLARLVRRKTGIPDAAPRQPQDPLKVFRDAAIRWPNLVEEVHDTLTRAELVAVREAAPTPGAREVMDACHQSGRPMVIVTDNGQPAIEWYLDAHRLTRYVSHIEAHVATDPSQMKPSPYLVTRAVVAAGRTANRCSLVGDSTADVDAARAAGVPVIGYANKPGKAERLSETGAHVVIDNMQTLAAALLATTTATRN